MTDNNKTPPAQFTPRFRTDIYPFIYPSKFRGSLEGKVAIITGPYLPFLPLPLPPMSLSSSPSLLFSFLPRAKSSFYTPAKVQLK